MCCLFWKKNSYSVQNERYHYIRYNDGSEELYDHQDDLKEWTNLAGKPGLDKIKKEMVDDLRKDMVTEVGE